MELQKIVNKYKEHRYYSEVVNSLNQSEKRILLTGLHASSRWILTATILEQATGIHFIILPDKDEAAYCFNDLQHALPDKKVFFFSSTYKRSILYNQADNGNLILRTDTMNQISEFTATQPGSDTLIVVTYSEAIAEKVINRQKLSKNTLHLIGGEKISISFIEEVLQEYGFERTDFVFEPGQYSIRGSIVDIFSYSKEKPYRIDFFGDEVESIRTFEVESQLSVDKLEKVSIVPNVHSSGLEKTSETIFDFAGNKLHLWISDIKFTGDRLNELFETLTSGDEKYGHIEDWQILSGAQFFKILDNIPTIEIGNKSYFEDVQTYSFQTKSQPAFNKNFQLLSENLQHLESEHYDIYIFSGSEKQIERLRSIFEDTQQDIRFTPIPSAIHEGFIDSDLCIACYTDHQIFERYHKYHISSYFSSKGSISLKEIKDLKPGDYVVHAEHGIGQFGGLEKIEVNGKVQEAIKLVYKDHDTLYVGIHSLHRISKYKGKDDSPPKIYKLGTGAWQKLKSSTKKKVKDIAKDLIALYAQRKSKKGYRFSPDTYLQDELEASFIYEDTPDQLKATKAVKSDMETTIPMDRLVCGDVGFGKTEVAVRAAFKAVNDSKQVAILVPTTILALQHYTTFRERLREFPCNIDYISRLKKPGVQKETLKKVETGKVDILIGTHRLLSKDIQFKDLGLLIIDEEQKFGVTAKEKLKRLKINVDTLTLTATPIPRTLQFSLMGARDLSIINTPPPNRHPIITEIHIFNEDIILEGINFELSRGGQVFFIHNRIQSIFEIENLIKRLVPRAKTAIGHGQMEGPKLEQIMIDFIHGDYDILVSTTIIESGLDIPNTNTIFINDAQNFGLSDLHQLRGRVGRSNRRAFCYLLAPPLSSLTPEARRRLKAIEEHSDLGSGFNIALQDLDIRGAGNLLGAEQSGFIADIGFETYNRILNEAMLELKENEFNYLFADEEKKEIRKYVSDCTIDTDIELHIPDEYVSNIAERIRLYRELDNAGEDSQLEEFKAKLTDRFGTIPKTVEDLLKVVRLRWLAVNLGFEKLILKKSILIIHFISDQSSPYYRSQIFSQILQFVHQNPVMFQMKEGVNKLTLTVKNIESIDAAYDLLLKMQPENTTESVE